MATTTRKTTSGTKTRPATPRRASGAATRASGASSRNARSTTAAKPRTTASRGTRTTTSRPTTGRRGTGTTTRQPAILSLIKKDHEEVKKMFKDFEKKIEATNKEPARDLAHKIIQELELHSKLEEEFVYPGLQQQDEDLFQEAEAEHHVADLLMKEIGTMNANDPSFKARVTVLHENVEHHIEEEEGQMFKQIKKLDKARLDRMAETWKSRKASGIPASMMS